MLLPSFSLFSFLCIFVLYQGLKCEWLLDCAIFSPTFCLKCETKYDKKYDFFTKCQAKVEHTYTHKSVQNATEPDLFNLKAWKHLSNLREVSMRLTCRFSYFEDRKTKCCVHVRRYFWEVFFLSHSNLKPGISFKNNLFTTSPPTQGKEEKMR